MNPEKNASLEVTGQEKTQPSSKIETDKSAAQQLQATNPDKGQQR